MIPTSRAISPCTAAIWPSGLHYRERMLPEGESDRWKQVIRAKTPAGHWRSRSTWRSPMPSVQTARSCASKRARTPLPTSSRLRTTRRRMRPSCPIRGAAGSFPARPAARMTATSITSVVPITFSSGDGGYGVEYPAASQYVTAVGGTTLTLNANNTYNSETVWSGTGSGCSAYEPKATWQKDIGCVRRTVADVAADADPNTGAAVYDSVRYQGQLGWFQVGGTSLASPLIAAVYALAGNAGSTTDGSYSYSHTSSLHDVTSGSNGSCGGSYLCTGKVGYDGPTGNGTPNGTSAF